MTFFVSGQSADRVKLDLEKSVSVPGVDAQHPHRAAIVLGPQGLFAILEIQPANTFSAPILTKADGYDSTTEGLRPFAYTGDATCQMYLRTGGTAR